VTDADRVAEILADWRDRRDRGEAPSPEEIVAAHPDLSDALREQFATQTLLDAVPGRVARESMPATLGEFRVLREIGRGGMGVVYEAEQTPMKRRVALKVLFPAVTSSPRAVERFQREARAAGRLHHTHLVPVYSMGSADGVWFYAMELVTGRSLDRVIDEVRETARTSAPGDTPRVSSDEFGADAPSRAHFERIAAAFAGVAEGLEAAHEAGIVHRDVKPANLILGSDGVLRLMDFGLARVAAESLATQSGQILGTPAYMSPEQLGGAATTLDGRTDVYSLGATLYEVLTLREPFPGERLPEVVASIRSRDPVPVRRIDPRVPRDLETIVQKAMEKEPERRYATAAQMAHDLRLFAEGGAIRARRIGLLGKAWRLARRRPLVTSLAAAVLVLSTTGVVLASLAGREAAARRTAEYDALLLGAQEVASQGLDWGGRGIVVSEVNLRTAASLLGRAVDLDPDRPEAYFARAVCCLQRPEGRLADLDAARERGLFEKTYRRARGMVLRMGDRALEAAEEDRRAALLPDSGRPEDAYFLGRACSVLGERQEAVRLLTAAIQGSTSSFVRAEARLSRAIDRVEDGDLEGAIEDFSAVSERGPGIRVQVASLWAQLGRKDRAGAEFEDVLARARDADSPKGWVSLCSLLGALRETAWWDSASAEAARRFPDVPEVLRARAACLGRRGDNDERAALLEQAIRRAPDDASLHRARGEALLDANRAEDALEALDRALRLDPEDLVAAAARARALVALNRADEGEASLRAFALRTPRGGESLLALGAFLTDTRDAPERADPVLRQAMRMVPTAPSCHFDLALVLRRRGTPPGGPVNESLLDEAATEIREAIRLEPRRTDFRVTLAAILQERGDHEAALAEALQAVRRTPKYAMARCALGGLYHESNPKAAAEQYEEAIRLDPGLARARAELAVLRVDESRFDEAAEQAKQAMGSPRIDDYVRHRARNALGRIALERKDYAAAVPEFQEAVRLAPFVGPYRYNLGLAYVRTGHADESMVEFEEALRLEGPKAETYAEIGEAWQVKGDDVQAIEAYGRAASLSPGDFAIECDFASALFRAGRLEEALTHYGRASEADPSSRLPLNKSATALEHVGRVAEAEARYRRAIDLSKGDARQREIAEGGAHDCALLVPSERALDAEAHGRPLPHDAPTLYGMATLAYRRQEHAHAVAVGAVAISLDPTFATEAVGCRYDVACAAALAGCGRGRDAARLDAAGRARSRAQALEWLRAEMAVLSAAEQDPDASRRASSRATYDHWMKDPDLTGVRDAPGFAEIQGEERSAWPSFWRDVRAHRDAAGSPESK
jgi:serine/threonine protein kinase/tetratricopeptide (TPR) repeat protein